MNLLLWKMISVFYQQEIFEKHFPFQKILKKNEIIKFRRIIPKNFCEIGDIKERKISCDRSKIHRKYLKTNIAFNNWNYQALIHNLILCLLECFYLKNCLVFLTNEFLEISWGLFLVTRKKKHVLCYRLLFNELGITGYFRIGAEIWPKLFQIVEWIFPRSQRISTTKIRFNCKLQERFLTWSVDQYCLQRSDFECSYLSW